MMEKPSPTEARLLPWRWCLKIAALLSLVGPTVLVFLVSLSLFPFGLLLAAAFIWYCWSFLSNLHSKIGFAKAIGTGLATFLLLLITAALGTDGFESDNLWVLILAGLLVLIPVALVVAAVKCYYSMGREPGDVWTLVGGLGLSLVYCVLIILPVSIVLPGLLRSRLAANQAAAVGSVRALSRCAAAYHSRYPDRGFPPSLSTLGPAAEKCIDGPLASGKKSGYKFAYMNINVDPANEKRDTAEHAKD